MNEPTSKRLWQPLTAAASASWQKRTARERQLLSLAALLMLLAGLWQMALEPALVTWREAPARQAALDKQTQQMRQLQAQAQALKKPTAVSRAESLRWLEANIPASLGSDATWRMQGERLNVRLANTSPEQLAAWLVQARERAQALPVQAQLQQTPTAAAGSRPPLSSKTAETANETRPKTPPDVGGPDVRWSGSLVLSLPGESRP